jgi:eukaryotic-like serine/threonine-protein kinase
VRGTPQPVLDGVAYSTVTGSAQLDFSGAGTVVYRSGGAGGGLVTVQWLDASGRTRPLLASPGQYMSPAMSPDGNRLALTSAGDIWIYESRRDSMMRLTFGGGYGNPHWSPEGRYIVFRSAAGMFWTRADGSGQPQPLTRSKNGQVPSSFTADGKRLAFVEIKPAGGAAVWTVPVESDGGGLRAGKPEAFLETPFNERSPSFSPDGRWLAYASDESGTLQLYVRAFSDKTAKRQISNSGGNIVVWSPNGRELFFNNMGSQIMTASYTVKGDLFLTGKPRLWSEKRIANVMPPWNFDLAPDGKHIVALMPTEVPDGEKAQHHVIFLLNFFDELRRRVPTGGRAVP